MKKENIAMLAAAALMAPGGEPSANAAIEGLSSTEYSLQEGYRIFSSLEQKILDNMDQDAILAEIIKMDRLYALFSKEAADIEAEITIINEQICRIYKDKSAATPEKVSAMNSLSKRLQPLYEKNNRLLNTKANLAKYRATYGNELNERYRSQLGKPTK